MRVDCFYLCAPGLIVSIYASFTLTSAWQTEQMGSASVALLN
jgi:hypothetical protein